MHVHPTGSKEECRGSLQLLLPDQPQCCWVTSFALLPPWPQVPVAADAGGGTGAGTQQVKSTAASRLMTPALHNLGDTAT
jgi:hypothetical protein